MAMGSKRPVTFVKHVKILGNVKKSFILKAVGHHFWPGPIPLSKSLETRVLLKECCELGGPGDG